MVKVGDRIEVVSTTSIKIKPGDQGDVVKIERTTTKQYIVWVDCGDKEIPLIEGDDKFKVIKKVN
jgi:hypothetical protein